MTLVHFLMRKVSSSDVPDFQSDLIQTLLSVAVAVAVLYDHCMQSIKSYDHSLNYRLFSIDLRS